jgi:AmmeMemoRadiSam system radical SAM enzyme/AmmeMemoRadiSam system protein B/AmmeMemoRadiSam system protein A
MDLAQLRAPMKSTLANEPLADLLDQQTTLAAPELWRSEADRLRCLACGHRCLIGAGQRGICKVRFNNDGQLKVPFGYVAGLQCDPVEKKPFFHVYPGSDALTFGMMGCDLHCSYCQNWITSQALRDSAAVAPVRKVTAGQLVEAALRERARLVVSSYNEPLITTEWAVAVFEEAKAAGLACAFVSNGNATPEVLDFLRPWIVAYKVDLKSFNDRNYRKLGGTLENITSTIRMIHERGIWLEVVTLVVPGFNDSAEELRAIARFLVSVSPDIPWHVTAFHKDYRMTDPEATAAETLVRAAEVGAEEGLRFIYAGNLPGRVGSWENTRCPSCQSTVIDRFGFLVRSYRLNPGGFCPNCQVQLPGIWPRTRGEVKTGNDQAAYQSRLPRPLGVATLRGGTHLQDRRQGLPVVHEPHADLSPPDLSINDHIKKEPAMATKKPTATASQPSSSPWPTLIDQQKQQVIAAVASLLRNQVAGEPAVFPAEMAEVASLVVAGAFVSLKRGKHLRSCCGMLGQPIPLHQALTSAAERTIWEDERFPPVSASELNHLEMEIWLLFNPQQVEARGRDRADALTIGKHGIKVVRGQSSGLFLPAVAVEHQWDVFTLLDRVCLKAGLPAAAWKEEDTTLLTFEGEVLSSPLAQFNMGALSSPVCPCGPEELPGLVALCRANLGDLLRGAAPRYFVGAPDGRLNGVVLQVQRLGSEELRSFTRLSLRPGLALQATLFGLVQAAAQYLGPGAINPQVLDTLPLGLTLLHDPVLCGSVAQPHLAGFDPQQRALLALERNKAGLVFDAAKQSDDLVQEAASLARVNQPDNTVVFSLAAVTNATRVNVSTAPTAVRGPAVRPAAVAGKFYPADPAELSRSVDQLLAGERQPEAWPAAMVPHAGLRFSGQIAADVLKRIAIPQTVIVIGPSHTGQGMEWAVAPHQTWELPGISVASDFMLARKLCQAIAGLEMDAAAHQHEHAIEVELPLLARLVPEVKVLGITIGHGDLESSRRFARGLADVLSSRTDKPLLLISSDMNHFASDAENRRLDALALAALDRRDPEELFQTVNRHHISMCGVLPAVIVLETLRLLGGCTRAQRVGYATTADVTGDTSRVVGYAGMLFG